MNDWKKNNEPSLSEKEDFESCLNMIDINEAYYTHTKIVSQDFEIKKVEEIFENFRNMFLKI